VTQPRQFVIGTLEVDLDLGQAKSGSTVYKLSPLITELLAFFHQHPNKLVTREILLAHVWKGKVVSDNAINRSISSLRQVLEGDKEQKAELKTIPRKGYVFEYEVPVEKHFLLQPKVLWSVAALVLVIAITIPTWMYFSAKQKIVKRTPPPPELIQLTDLQGIESDPSVSNDGKWLLFRGVDEEAENSRLFLQDLKSKQLAALTAKQTIVLRPNWSASNKSIIFIEQHQADARLCFISMLDVSDIFDAQSTLQTGKTKLSVERLLPCDADSKVKAIWGPDDNTIYFNQRESIESPYALYRYSLSTKQQKQVTLPQFDGIAFGDIDFSYDHQNKQLAVLRDGVQHQMQLILIQEASANATQAYPLSVMAEKVAFKGSSEQVYIAAKSHLHLLSLETAQLTPVKTFSRAIGSIEYSEALNRVLVSLQSYDVNVAQQSQDNPSAQQSISRSTRIDRMPRVNPNNGMRYYISDRSGQNEFWQLDTQGYEIRVSQLPFQIPAVQFDVWEGFNSLLFAHENNIYQLKLDSHELVPLYRAESEVHFVSGMPGERQIVFNHKIDGEWQLSLLDLPFDTVLPLTNSGGYSGYLSKDRQSLFFSKLHQPGMWVLNRATGRESLLFDNFPVKNWINWYHYDGDIYYRAHHHQSDSILQYNVSEKTVTPLYRYPKTALREWAINPVKKELLFASVDNYIADIYGLKH